jgi:surface protein
MSKENRLHSQGITPKTILLGLVFIMTMLSACAPKSQKSKAQFSLTPSMGFTNLNMAGGAVIYGQRVDGEGSWSRVFKGDKEPIIEMDVGKWNFSVIAYAGPNEVGGVAECGIAINVNIGEEKESVDIKINQSQCAQVGLKPLSLKMCSEADFQNPEAAGNCVADGGFKSYRVQLLEKVAGTVGGQVLTSLCYNISGPMKPRVPTGNSPIPINPIRVNGFTGLNCAGPRQAFLFERSLFKHNYQALKTFGTSSNYFAAFDLSAPGIDESAPEVEINTLVGTNFVPPVHWVNNSNKSSITVQGTCTKFIDVELSVGATTLGTVTCNGLGNFTKVVDLTSIPDSNTPIQLIATQTKDNGLSTSNNFPFKKDTVAPVLSLSILGFPAPPYQFKGGSTYTVNYSFTDSGGSGAGTNSLDASVFATSNLISNFSSGSHSISYLAPSINTSAGVLTLTGSDIAGNTAVTETISNITIDSTDPSVTGASTDPFDESNMVGALREFEDGDVLRFAFTVSDTTGISSAIYQYSTDGKLTWEDFPESEASISPADAQLAYTSSAPLTLTLASGLPDNAPLHLKAIITDGVGNEYIYTTASNTYSIDNQIPTVTTSDPTTLDTGAGNQTVSFVRDDSDTDDIVFSCFVGSDPCSSSNIEYFVSFTPSSGDLVLNPVYADIALQQNVDITIKATELAGPSGANQSRTSAAYTYSLTIENPFSFTFNNDGIILTRFHTEDTYIDVETEGAVTPVNVSYKVLSSNLTTNELNSGTLSVNATNNAINLTNPLVSHEFSVSPSLKTMTIEGTDTNGNKHTETFTFSVVNPIPLRFQINVTGSETYTLPLDANYNHHFEVYWGDNSSNIVSGAADSTNSQHTYSAGIYDVEIYGKSGHIIFGLGASCAFPITKVFQLGDLKYESMESMFKNCGLLEEFTAAPTNTSQVVNFSHFLQSSPPSLTDIDLTGVTMESATDISYLFSTSKVVNLTLSNPLYTGAVTNMDNMFQNTINLTTLDITPFNFSSVSSIDRLFHNSNVTTINGIDLIDTSSVTSMREVFKGASNFNGDLSGWDTSGVTDMSHMFSDASNFNADLSTWTTSSVTDMRGMFYGASNFNSPLSTWDTGLVINMNSMFKNASSFNQDIDTWDVSGVTAMQFMFFGATSFNQPISSWDFSGISDPADTEAMFQDASSYSQDLSIIKSTVSGTSGFCTGTALNSSTCGP